MQNLHLEGPVSLTEVMIDRLKTHLYVFGDEHIHNMKCLDPNTRTIRIDKFLDEIVKTTPKTIDLFLELDFPDKTKPSLRDVKYQVAKQGGDISYLATPDYITDIFHLFYGCFQHDKHDCQHKNLRAHYTDIRSIGTTSYILAYAFNVNDTYRQFQLQDLKRQLIPGAVQRPQQDTRPVIKSIIDDGLKILRYLPFELKDVYSTAKVDKQLRNITDLEVLRAIHAYYDDKIWTSLLDAEDSYKSYTENSTMEDIKIGINHLFDYASLLFEVYIVGRMFRGFNAQSPQNIILYLGDHHSLRIVDFLRTVFGARIIHQQISDQNGVNKQCLNLAGFKLPFFQ